MFEKWCCLYIAQDELCGYSVQLHMIVGPFVLKRS